MIHWNGKAPLSCFRYSRVQSPCSSLIVLSGRAVRLKTSICSALCSGLRHYVRCTVFRAPSINPAAKSYSVRGKCFI